MWYESEGFLWQEEVGGDILRAGARLRHSCQGNWGGWEEEARACQARESFPRDEHSWESDGESVTGCGLSSTQFKARCGTQCPPLCQREVEWEMCESPLSLLPTFPLSPSRRGSFTEWGHYFLQANTNSWYSFHSIIDCPVVTSKKKKVWGTPVSAGAEKHCSELLSLEMESECQMICMEIPAVLPSL